MMTMRSSVTAVEASDEQTALLCVRDQDHPGPSHRHTDALPLQAVYVLA
jgi:hypothetical protein